MGTSLHQTIKFCSWLTGVYSDFNQATYFCVLSRFSMTHNKGKKCASLYPLESMEHSNGKKLFRLDWKKAIYQPLFALGGYGIHVHESRFSAFQQERKSQTKSIGKMFFLPHLGRVRQTGTMQAGLHPVFINFSVDSAMSPVMLNV